jgi:hypothetical protein
VEEQKKMKKILVVLLAILVTGGLFAQITFTGDVKSGLNITQSSDKYNADNDPKVKLWNDDAGQRFYLTGKLDFDDDYGFEFGLKGAHSDKDTKIAEYDYARLYGEFLNDMLKLTVGSGTGAAWNAGGRLDPNFDDSKGIKLEVKPIEGLNVGFQLRTELEGDMTVEQWFKETAIGAKYEMPNLFKAVVAFKLDSDYDGDTSPYNTDADIINDGGNQMKALLGVNVTAVPNLEAIVDGYIYGLGDLEKYGVAAIGEKLGYQITPALKAGAGFTEKLDLKKRDDNDDRSTFRFEAEPYVNYKLSDLITLDLNIPFAMGWTDPSAKDVADAAAKIYANPPTATDKDYQTVRNALDLSYQIGVKPAVTFTLSDHASINTYYKLQMTQYKDVPAGMEDAAIIDHTVQVSFNWSF